MNAVVVLVLLMARIRPIERVVGADRLARWHAMGGRYVIGLISGHALAITWGYAVTAHTNPVSETATLLTTYPDVLMATVAWFLLLGVALVSARAVRRRMSYETYLEPPVFPALVGDGRFGFEYPLPARGSRRPWFWSHRLASNLPMSRRMRVFASVTTAVRTEASCCRKRSAQAAHSSTTTATAGRTFC